MSPPKPQESIELMTNDSKQRITAQVSAAEEAIRLTASVISDYNEKEIQLEKDDINLNLGDNQECVDDKER